ncbi:MAG: hypothetical protein JXB04_10105 [Kiritimatiellae bacterium]|nr:hypothetical protein [Kiritimatiellia bacterium]
MTTRRTAFWFLVILFAAGVVTWVLHVPYAPWRLYAAVPPEASFVSAHTSPAARWGSLAGNPLTRSLLNTIGLDPPMADALSTNKAFRAWIERLASDEVVVAYVPGWVGGEDAWVIASWIGGRSQRLRWLLACRNKLDIKTLGRHDGRMIWMVTDPSLRGEVSVSFALDEGMALACVSRNPAAIRRVLDTLDAHTADARARRPRMACDEADALDRGWLRGADSGLESRWEFALSDLQPGRLAGAVCAPRDGSSDGDGMAGMDLAALGQVLGDLPLAVWGVSTRTAREILVERVRTRWAAALSRTLEQDGGPGVVIAVLGQEYSGRLKGIKWPGIVACIQLVDADSAPAAVRAYLDGLNARYQWGLIPRELAAGERPVFVVESTADTIYSDLAVEERVAYTVCGKWLVVCSNADALLKLAARYDRDEAREEQAAGRWRRQAPVGTCRGFGWVDLAEGGRIMRLALTAYALKLATDDPRGTRRVRQRLNEAKAWMDALAPLEEGRWSLAGDGDRLRVAFEMGVSTSREH